MNRNPLSLCVAMVIVLTATGCGSKNPSGTKAVEPTDAAGYARRAAQRYASDRHAEAIADYDQAIRLNPTNAAYYNDRAVSHQSLKQYDQAIADCTKAIELEPMEYLARFNRGISYGQNGDNAKALADFTKSLELKPDSRDVWIQRALTHNALKQHDKAIADFTKALELDESNAITFHDRGLAWRRKKEFDKAITDFEKARQIDPTNPTFTGQLAATYYQMKDYAKAKAIALEAESDRNVPNGLLLAMYIAKASFALKEYDDAFTYFTTLVSQHEDAYAIRECAKFLASCPKADKRDGSRALELANRVADVRSPNVDWSFPDMLAMVHAELGDFDTAVTQQTKAITKLKADKDHDPADLTGAEARLKLYTAKKPYRVE